MLKKWREGRKARQQERDRDTLEHFKSGEPSRSLRELAHHTFMDDALNPEPRVVTCPEGVVAYVPLPPDARRPKLGQLLGRLFDPEAMDNKIREIFAANPDTDFAALAPALGIKVISAQKTKPPAPPQEKYIV